MNEKEKQEAVKLFNSIKKSARTALKSAYGSRWSKLGRKKQEMIQALVVADLIRRSGGSAPTNLPTFDELAAMNTWDLGVLLATSRESPNPRNN